METIQQSDKNHHTEYLTNGISPHVNMSDVEDEDQNDNLDEMEDDDPGKLLNEWLGELNTLKQVNINTLFKTQNNSFVKNNTFIFVSEKDELLIILW